MNGISCPAAPCESGAGGAATPPGTGISVVLSLRTAWLELRECGAGEPANVRVLRRESVQPREAPERSGDQHAEKGADQVGCASKVSVNASHLPRGFPWFPWFPCPCLRRECFRSRTRVRRPWPLLRARRLTSSFGGVAILA